MMDFRSSRVGRGEWAGARAIGISGTNRWVWSVGVPVILPRAIRVRRIRPPGKGGSMGRMAMEHEPQDTAETEPGRPSKSALKREASSLQELGVKLSALPDQEIKE